MSRYRVLQVVFVAAVRILSVASKDIPNILNATPTLLTYQGYVSDVQPVVVHVLLKAKLLQSGVYLMRAVLYTQKTRLESKGWRMTVGNWLTVRQVNRNLQATKLLRLLFKKSRWFWSTKTWRMMHLSGLGCSSPCSACTTSR